MKYFVKRAIGDRELDGDWESGFWHAAQPLTIGNYMGDKPEHLPHAQTRCLYDDDYIYVIFRVDDRYVRAVSSKYNDNVWCDSCAEFFFTPGDDITKGYFNLEMTCGGVMLMCHQIGRGKDCVLVDESDAKRIERFHSMPTIIDPEISEPVTWTLEYRLPIDFLEKYAPVIRPASGVTWRANFYKCADESSHPHWLIWSKIDLPEPDFHQPQYFGTLEFE